MAIYDGSGTYNKWKIPYISMDWCKTAATRLLTHWSYCSLALSHRYNRPRTATSVERTATIYDWSGAIIKWTYLTHDLLLIEIRPGISHHIYLYHARVEQLEELGLPGVMKLWVAWEVLRWLMKFRELCSGGFHPKLVTPPYHGFLNVNTPPKIHNSKRH